MIATSITPTKIIAYGSFLSVILSKKSRPGDGMFGRGLKG
ncbi:lariocidin family lasso peptide [Trinickia acidisoli]